MKARMDSETKRRRALSREQSKIRILVIAKMLNEGRRLTARQILGRLQAQYDITVDRKTLYDDIAAIDKIMPIDVRTGRYGGYQKWSFGGGRRWQLKSG